MILNLTNRKVLKSLAGIAGCWILLSSLLYAEPTANEKLVREASQRVVSALNEKKIDEVVQAFLPEGELVDESGRVHKGHKELRELLAAYFEKHSEVKAEVDVESISGAGPVLIEHGKRTMRVKEGESPMSVKYTAVWLNADGAMKLVSLTDLEDAEEATGSENDDQYDDFVSPDEALQPLDWLVGDWVNEGSDGRVKLQYRKSEDGNFIVGELDVIRNDQSVLTSTVRIGWDGSLEKIRSWIFDSDGGISESVWTQTPDAWIIQSKSVSPDALTGSATVIIKKASDNRVEWSGRNRLIGDSLEDDFELVLVRKPPAPEDLALQDDHASAASDGHADASSDEKKSQSTTKDRDAESTNSSDGDNGR